MTWGTIDYPAAPGCHLTGRPWGDPEPCATCGGPYWADAHARVAVHRDLAPAELPGAVYAMEASDDHARSWASNGLRWADPEDARRYAGDLAMRWLGATDMRVVRVTPPDPDGGAYTVVEVVATVL